MSESQAHVNDIGFYFAGIPMKNTVTEGTIRPSGPRQSEEPECDLQDNSMSDMGIQLADKKLLEHLFGTAVAEQCRCYHKSGFRQRSSSRTYRILHTKGLYCPHECDSAK